jgi:hypothetical protein
MGNNPRTQQWSNDLEALYPEKCLTGSHQQQVLLLLLSEAIDVYSVFYKLFLEWLAVDVGMSRIL